MTLVAGLGVAQEVGADALLGGVVRLELGAPVGGAAHAERGGGAGHVVAVARRGDRVEADACWACPLLGLLARAGSRRRTGPPSRASCRSWLMMMWHVSPVASGPTMRSTDFTVPVNGALVLERVQRAAASVYRGWGESVSGRGEEGTDGRRREETPTGKGKRRLSGKNAIRARRRGRDRGSIDRSIGGDARRGDSSRDDRAARRGSAREREDARPRGISRTGGSLDSPSRARGAPARGRPSRWTSARWFSSPGRGRSPCHSRGRRWRRARRARARRT